MLKKKSIIKVIMVIIGIGVGMNNLYAKQTDRYEHYNHAQLVYPKIDYALRLKSKGMFCEMVVNDVIMANNLGMVAGISQTVTGINEIISSGENTFGVNVASWNWIDKKTRNTLSTEAKNQFRDPDDFCQVALQVTTFKHNPQTDQYDKVPKIVASVRASVNEQGKLEISQQSYDYDEAISPASTLQLIDLPEDKRTGFMKDLDEIYEVTRSFTAKNVPDWLWVSAPRYDDVPNNRELLEEAYRELWQALRNKDKKAVQDLVAISTYEMYMGNTLIDVDAEAQQDTFDQLYDEDTFDANSTDTINPIHFEGFYPQTFADGRLVILTNNDYASPIMQSDNTSVFHYFAFIDGKFRVVR